MPTSTGPILLAMFFSALTFLAAVAWGVAFAFPEPDASPAQSAQLQLHANISGALMFLSVLVFASALTLLVWRWLARRFRGSAATRQQ